MKFIYILLTLVVLVVLYFIVLGFISRSGEAPGLVNGKLAMCGNKPNSVCSENDPDTEHYVAPLPVAEDGLQSVSKVIESMGGNVKIKGQNYIAAEFQSQLFGFVDDLELRWDHKGNKLHVRSASRVGYSDLGANRDRVNRLRELLEGY